MNSNFIPEKEHMGPPKVLLTNTDRWPGPSRLAITLVKEGFQVSAFCPVPGHPFSKTRCIREVLEYNGFRPLSSLEAAIQTVRPDFVIPCDDLAVNQLQELFVRAAAKSDSYLTDLIRRSLGNPELASAFGRFEILTLANEEGIRVPECAAIRSRRDLQAFGDRVGFPIVIKADGTWGGRGVRIAQSAREADQAWTELSEVPSPLKATKRLLLERDRFWLRSWYKRTRPQITAQSYIVGRPANCAVFCWQGEVLAGIAVEVVSTQELTGPAVVVRVVDSKPMLDAARRIARRLGMSGFFGLDFMIDEFDAAYLIEMNPRSTPLCHLQLGQGRDLVRALRAKMTSQKFESAPAITGNDLIAYFPRAQQTGSKFLAASYHDVPEGEPELTHELLHPWSGRSWLGRLVDLARPSIRKAQNPTQSCIFEAAVADRTTS
jgi:hypothetical protein